MGKDIKHSSKPDIGLAHLAKETGPQLLPGVTLARVASADVAGLGAKGVAGAPEAASSCSACATHRCTATELV